MIFAGQEKPVNHFSEARKYKFQNKLQNPCKFAEIMKKNKDFGKFHS